ncbi:hypothetical protein OSB04_008437 [Centaurea solstitialis]|uniref:Uncharacterized protein n=1 Tax=Centaurea solstitialis TaxID=347529 RepID=A0AA38U527_9ASTR|nr:hypothetical protein OSB04_008437 [Centaurea solstitialis]
MKSDSFTLDMEPFSHLTNKDLTLTSRINLQRSHPSRKGSQTGAEKKMDSNFFMNDGDTDAIPTPKACLVAGTTPEKVLVNQTTDQITKPQLQHQIAIMAGGSTTTIKPAGNPLTKFSLSVKRSTSFKQSSLFNPRSILFFFATL